MFKKMKHMKNEKGLTLIELLAVIVILAIIAAISIPAIGSIINNTRDKAVLSDVQGAVSAAKIALADGSCDTPVTAAGSTTVTCNAYQIEFTSEKFADVAASGTIPAHKNITVKFTNGVASEIKTVLKNGFSGKKIPDAIGTKYVSDTKTLTVSETDLNGYLD